MWCSVFIRFLNPPEGNCLHGYSLCIRFPYLPSRDCRQGVQPDCSCSKPTSRGQSAGVHPVLQFQNLPPWDCWTGDYRLFIKLRTYFQGTARVWCILFIRFLNLTAGNCLPEWSLFIWFLNLPPGDCLQGMQLV